MCGICGIYKSDNKSHYNSEIVKSMNDQITHRGPDDEGYYSNDLVEFGFRRLSIIDLAGGHQPMSDAQEEIWIVFNGEIYNFKELRDELRQHGHHFRTKSDTEVIINGYKQWGADVFSHLNGMFGLAIWDNKAKRLLIARDPLGIKVVYYKIDSGNIIFASEIKAVLAADNSKKELDATSLSLFLRFRYTPSPLTLFKKIKKLAPGTMLIAENGNIEIKRWYNYIAKPFQNKISDDEAKEELLFKYKNAVKRHLISDVPVGLLLSSGIDSGLLLGLMSEQGRDWNTYTIGYGKQFEDDEIEDALETAEIYDSKHNSIYISRTDFEKALPNIVKCLEEPVASSSIVPMYFVCQRAREDVKVALIGQGPDELFGGYQRHYGIHYGKYWRKMPDFLKGGASGLLSLLPRNDTIKRGLYSLNEPDQLERFIKVFSLIPGGEIDNLFHDGLLASTSREAIKSCWDPLTPYMENLDELNAFQILELKSSLPDELLMYGDKLSMAHSLEVRVPYLDREVVEYVQCLRDRYKVRRGKLKWLHREVCNDFLPKTIINRKKKGFAVNVVDQWFKGSIGARMNNYLVDESSMLYRYLKPKHVKKLYADHMSGKDDNHKILFSLVVFEEWLRNL